MTLETPSAPVKEGDVVADKYRVERTIGAGGMGVVMAARHLTLGEPVALKFVIDSRGNDKEAKARMMREARATFRLRSEHTVRVLDVGELPSGPLYIVMELLEGRDLKAELTARGPLPEGEVVRYALEACDALEEAHSLGIVHRDLKPHNLFLSRSPRGATVLKILDFGMSKLDPEMFEASPLTRPATALGTPRYMAPEQWKSATEVDARADVWALGVVMYELLTGKAPVAELRGAERQARLLAGAIPDPRELGAQVSEGVTRAVMKCLRADPAVRWRTVRHLATALRDAHPELAKRPERAETTRTDITREVPPGAMARNAAAAFATAPPTPPAPLAPATPPSAVTPLAPITPAPMAVPGVPLKTATTLAPETEPASPPTRRETPEALHEAGRPDDFDVRTEVRPPPGMEGTMASGTLASGTPSPVAVGRPNAATLRSAAANPEVQAKVAAVQAKVEAVLLGRDKTLRMVGAPSRDATPGGGAGASREASAPAPVAPAAAVASPPPPAPALAPPSVPSPAPVSLRVAGRPASRPSGALLVAAGVISFLALLAIGWAVLQWTHR